MEVVESSPGPAKTLAVGPGKTVPEGGIAGTASGGSSCTACGSGQGTMQKRMCLGCWPTGGGRRRRIGAGPGEGVEGSASTVGSVGEGSASTVGSEGEGSASSVGSEEEGSASTVGSEGVEEPGIGSLPDPPLRGGRERGQPCGSTLLPACGCAGGVMGQEENGEVTPTAQLT